MPLQRHLSVEGEAAELHRRMLLEKMQRNGKEQSSKPSPRPVSTKAKPKLIKKKKSPRPKPHCAYCCPSCVQGLLQSLLGKVRGHCTPSQSQQLLHLLSGIIQRLCHCSDSKQRMKKNNGTLTPLCPRYQQSTFARQHQATSKMTSRNLPPGAIEKLVKLLNMALMDQTTSVDPNIEKLIGLLLAHQTMDTHNIYGSAHGAPADAIGGLLSAFAHNHHQKHDNWNTFHHISNPQLKCPHVNHSTLHRNKQSSCHDSSYNNRKESRCCDLSRNNSKYDTLNNKDTCHDHQRNEMVHCHGITHGYNNDNNRHCLQGKDHTRDIESVNKSMRLNLPDIQCRNEPLTPATQADGTQGQNKSANGSDNMSYREEQFSARTGKHGQRGRLTQKHFNHCSMDPLKDEPQPVQNYGTDTFHNANKKCKALKPNANTNETRDASAISYNSCQLRQMEPLKTETQTDDTGGSLCAPNLSQASQVQDKMAHQAQPSYNSHHVSSNLDKYNRRYPNHVSCSLSSNQSRRCQKEQTDKMQKIWRSNVQDTQCTCNHSAGRYEDVVCNCKGGVMPKGGREQYSCSGTNRNVMCDCQGHIMSKVDHNTMSNVREIQKGMKESPPGGCTYQRCIAKGDQRHVNEYPTPQQSTKQHNIPSQRVQNADRSYGTCKCRECIMSNGEAQSTKHNIHNANKLVAEACNCHECMMPGDDMPNIMHQVNDAIMSPSTDSCLGTESPEGWTSETQVMLTRHKIQDTRWFYCLFMYTIIHI